MNIAIQGHPTRGKEVIQIFESLGGINRKYPAGKYANYFYYISSDDSTIAFTCIRPRHLNVFTLEEFEKEFPFKIGDRVISSTTGLVGTVIDFSESRIYRFKCDDGIESFTPAVYLKLYKEMKEERNITLTLDKAKEWYKKGGELKEVALQAYSEEELSKDELPKTFEEFCEKYPVKKGECYLSSNDSIIICKYDKERTCINWIPSEKSAGAHLALIQLEQLRDCYRGLFITVIGMPVWCIIRHKGRLVITQRIWGTNETFLSFQSHEVAEEYLKNFEPLIKQAGDLI